MPGPPPPVHVADVIEVSYDGSLGKVERPRHTTTPRLVRGRSRRHAV
jgi:hypothetical protein